MVDLYYLPVQSRMHVQESSDLCLGEQSALTESLNRWHASGHAEYGKHNEKISLLFERCDSSPYPRHELRGLCIIDKSSNSIRFFLQKLVD